MRGKFPHPLTELVRPHDRIIFIIEHQSCFAAMRNSGLMDMRPLDLHRRISLTLRRSLHPHNGYSSPRHCPSLFPP